MSLQTDILGQTACGVVFPGQGAQRPGMARDFYEAFSEARLAFEEASEACSLDLARLCFEESERLGLTEYAQPAILTAEIAMFRVVQKEAGLRPDYFGGHSLGEYTALVAAGVLGFSSAVRIVRQRGRLMQEAVPEGRGGMVAVVGGRLDRHAVFRALDGLEVAVSNDNSPSQIVLSGLRPSLEEARRRIATIFGGREALRTVWLDVSAPFHCELMRPVELPLQEILEREAKVESLAAAEHVTSNYTGTWHQGDRSLLMRNLARQAVATVRWRDNMDALASVCGRIVEIGPSAPLRGLFENIGVPVRSITGLRALERLKEERPH
ncbi:MAG: ACP S-malonyltransferase [Candidatus Dadabacteria bacterium]|nr:MAG: ACP S-malonyltransferase [Candidatus Dadabacteria bacterium]